MFGRRPDAKPIDNLPTMRRFLPFASPRRNDSTFYMFQDIEVEAALEYLEKKNVGRPHDRRITLFHLLLRSSSQALKLRPGVNRFVKGGRLWQRDGEWISFSAMREIKDGSVMMTIKRLFHPESETLEEMVDGFYERLNPQRKGRKTQADKEMMWLLRLPSVVTHFLMLLLKIADYFGLMPRKMIEPDPLFTSVFLANLGSIDYPAGFHHLWEYGTCSLFGVMGRVEPGENGRRKIRMAWTYDERINDGLYSYYTLDGIRERLEKPGLLDLTTDELAKREREGPVR
jgi:hypothetical protein